MDSKIWIDANVVLELFGPGGDLREYREVHNTVTASGKGGVADRVLAAPALNNVTHMAVGSGATAANALGAEMDRNALTSKTAVGPVVTMVGTWIAGDGTGGITEAGTFDAAGAGNMWMGADFAVINKGALDSLVITWTLTVG